MPTKKSHTRGVIVALTSAGVLVAVLAGCTGPDTAPTPGPAVTTAAPAPSATATQTAPPVEAGAEVDADQPLPANTKAFPLPDGTAVAVVKDKPLPAPVKKALEKQARSTIAVQPKGDASTDAYENATSGARRFVKSAQEATGKSALVIFEAQSAPEDPNKTITVYLVSSSSTTLRDSASPTLEAAKDFAQSYIDQQMYPETWTVIVRK